MGIGSFRVAAPLPLQLENRSGAPAHGPDKFRFLGEPGKEMVRKWALGKWALFENRGSNSVVTFLVWEGITLGSRESLPSWKSEFFSICFC